MRFTRTPVLLCLMLFAPLLQAADFEILEKTDSFDVQTSTFATEYHREMVKILTMAGTHYDKRLLLNSYSRVHDVQGKVWYPDGRVAALKPEDILELPVFWSADSMTDLKQLVITPPKLERGCRLQIEYQRSVTSLLDFEPWIYATTSPIDRASATLTFPSTIPMKYHCTDPAVVIRSSELEGKTTVHFDAKSQKEILVLGSVSESEDTSQHVDFLPEKTVTEKAILSTKSWPEIATWYTELTRYTFQWDASMDEALQEITSKNKEPERIAEAAYRYLQDHFVYTAVEIGIGGYKPRFAGRTFQTKFGDCKDLAFLYITFLRKAGIEAWPALVDTRNDRFFYSDFPSPRQFNHCIVYLPTIRNGTWVDCTVKYFKFYQIPSALQGKYALVAGGPNDLVRIPEDLYNANVAIFSLSGSLHEGAVALSGHVELAGTLTALTAARNLLSANDVYRFLFDPLIPVQNLEIPPAGEPVFTLSLSTTSQDAAPFKILLVNPFRYAPFENVSLDASSSQYFALGSPIRIVVHLQIELHGEKLISPKGPEQLRGKYIRHDSLVSQNGDKLDYSSDTYVAGGLLNSDELKEYQKDLRHLQSVLDRTVIIQ